MTFLNAILLAGAAAFLIPLLIHLLNKRKVHLDGIISCRTQTNLVIECIEPEA